MNFDTAVTGHSFFMTHGTQFPPPAHTHLPGALRAVHSPEVLRTRGGDTHRSLFLHPHITELEMFP